MHRPNFTTGRVKSQGAMFRERARRSSIPQFPALQNPCTQCIQPHLPPLHHGKECVSCPSFLHPKRQFKDNKRYLQQPSCLRPPRRPNQTPHETLYKNPDVTTIKRSNFPGAWGDQQRARWSRMQYSCKPNQTNCHRNKRFHARNTKQGQQALNRGFDTVQTNTHAEVSSFPYPPTLAKTQKKTRKKKDILQP